MKSLLSVKRLIKNLPCRRIAVVMLAAAALLGVCRSETDGSAPAATVSAATPDLDAEIARASYLREPSFILVIVSERSPADDHARKVFEKSAARKTNIVTVLLDLNISRNRATAARFHLTNTPALFGLSPRGLIVSRDQEPITKELLRNRMEDVARRGKELDAKFALLEQAANGGNDAAAQLDLADFLLAQHNAREAVPRLESVAHSESADTTLRVRAWVELARAHLWIAEPEKGRHEAEDLMATLGPKTAEALAGGNLVMGLQDANAKRAGLARQELGAAVAAAPASDYAEQANEALAKLPGEPK
jgi:hypothetical protein